MTMLYLGADVDMHTETIVFRLTNAAVISLIRKLKDAEVRPSSRGNERSIDVGIATFINRCRIVEGWMYAYGPLEWSQDQVRAVNELMIHAGVGGPRFCDGFQADWEHLELSRSPEDWDRFAEAFNTLPIESMRKSWTLSKAGVLTLPCPDILAYRKHMVAAWDKKEPHRVVWYEMHGGKSIRRWSAPWPKRAKKLGPADYCTNQSGPGGRDNPDYIIAVPHDAVISSGRGNLSTNGFNAHAAF